MSTNPLTYQNMDVELSTVDTDGSFQVSVVNGSTSALTTGAAEISVYDPDAIPEGANIQKSTTTLLNRLSRRRAAHEELVELGTRLADLILPGHLREIFLASLGKARQEQQGLRLRLQIGSGVLTTLPWELLFIHISADKQSSGEFLAQMPDVSIARKGIASQVEVIGTADPVEKIRLSAVLASPWGLDELDLEKEERVILSAATAVDESGQALQVTVLGSLTDDTPASTRQELSAAAEGAHIFYFAGHGRSKNDGESQIFLEDEDGDPDAIGADELAKTLESTGVRLAVLGSCDGGRKGDVDSWSGVATGLSARNIPAVLTFQDTIRERNATVFMAVLLARLLAGYTVDEAVFEGRQAIVAADQGGRERDWMVPSLYLRTGDGYLFPLPEESAGSSDDKASLRIRQQLRRVEDSSVIGLKAQALLEGDVRVEQVVEELRGSSLVGASLGSIGASGSAPFEHLSMVPRMEEEAPPAPMPLEAPEVGELRVDAAVPDQVHVDQSFDLAVSVRQFSSPVLAEADLENVHSGDVQVAWPESEPFVRLSIQVRAPECEIHGPDRYSFRLYAGEDSPVFYFQLTPKEKGEIGIIVTIMQEDDWLGGARIRTVSSEQVVGSIEVGVTSQSLDGDEQTALHRNLVKYFNLAELNVLAVDLGIDYENLPGETINEKGMELVLYCERHGHLAALVDRLHQLRPQVSW